MQLKSGKLCNFWRFLQNLDENQKESLLYSQNEQALLWYILMRCLIIKHWKSELLYVTEKFIGFKKENLWGHILFCGVHLCELWERVKSVSVMDPCW